MWQFNLVVTMAGDGRFRDLLAELEPHGEFHKTEFLGVVLGRVEEPRAFLELVRQSRERQLIAFQDVGRIVPVESCFTFMVEDFLEKVQEAVRPYIELLAGRRFYVRLERRGHKGEIVSPDAERALDGFIMANLATAGRRAEVDFAAPDAVVAVETIGDRCGIGLLTREMLERYPFVRAD